jgi:flagellar hook assembly protein FlgD
MTMIKYEMRKTGYVSLKIYDITGKLVRNLVEGKQALGSHTIIWNCTDDCDRKLPPSIYLSRLKTLEGATETKELIILR